ncbi:MAG: DnaA regulatory inactivator Hda [Pseudomonadota bacterium]
MSQLPLNVGLDDHARFGTYHAGPNELAVAALQALKPPGLWLFGPPGCGKSHLLQASAHAADLSYLALGEVPAPAVLSGAPRPAGIALDDLDRIAGDPDWERSLLSLYDAVTPTARLLVSSSDAPAELPVDLPDLASRLRALPAYALMPLDDAGRVRALGLRAERRGLDISPATLEFLIRREPRDMKGLYDLLERLDKAALGAGRRLTLPFVRAFLRREHGESQESA